MPRPKKPPTVELQWRIPVDLMERARDAAAADGVDPGAWLTLLIANALRATPVDTGTLRPSRAPLNRDWATPIPKAGKR